MRTIRSETVVDATPAAVWGVLTDLDAYAEWNPHIVAASGAVEEGARIRITVDRGERTRQLRPTVTVVDPPERLEWRTTAGTSLLFAGRHAFELAALDDGRTLLVNRETLSGLLARFVAGADDAALCESMNWALAERLDRQRTADAVEPEP
jgi:hypothetical protein